MKNFLLTISLLFIACACTGMKPSHSQEANTPIIVYFSATGNTEEAAKIMQRLTGAEMLEILPAEVYTDADLDWHNKQSRSSIEMQDSSARPALKDTKVDLSKYNVIYLGYPVWWDQAPRIINSFLDTQDLKGKTIIPFCTSGSSTIDNSQEQLRKTYPEAKWLSGRRLTDMQEDEIEAWVLGDDEEDNGTE